MASQYRVTFHYMYNAYQYVENTIWETDSFDSLDYSFNANDVTEATLVLYSNQDVPPVLSSRNISMRIWRKPSGQNSYQLEGGTEWLVMRVVKSVRAENEGGTVYTITAYHPLIALRRRVVAYKADTLYADKQDYPSLMIAKYVDDNLANPVYFDGSEDSSRQLGYTSKNTPDENYYSYLQSSKTLTRLFTVPSIGIYSANISKAFSLNATPSPDNRVLKLNRNFTVPKITDKIYFQSTTVTFSDFDRITLDDSTVGFVSNMHIEGNETRFDFTRLVGSENRTFLAGHEAVRDIYHMYLEGGALFFEENDSIRIASPTPYTIDGIVTITRGTPISYTVMNLVNSTTIGSGTTQIILRGTIQYFRENDTVSIGSGAQQVTGKITGYQISSGNQTWNFAWESGATNVTYEDGTDVRNNSNTGREQRWLFTKTSSTATINIQPNDKAENTKYDIYVSLAAGDPESQKFNSGDFIRLRIIDYSINDPETNGVIYPYPGYREVWGQVTNPYTVSSSEQRWTFSLVSGIADTVFSHTNEKQNTVWDFGTRMLPSVSGSWQNLLRIIQDLAAEQDKDGNRTYFQFRAMDGNNTFEVRQNYLNQDRRKKVQFSLAQGNLSEVVTTIDYEKEVNFVYAGGSGSGAAQAVELVSSETLQKGTAFFRSEEYQTFADWDGDLLREEGRRFLSTNRAKLTLRARVYDMPDCAYGVHYQHGDLVSVFTEDGVYDCHVYAVSVSVRDNEESVDIYLDAQINI